MVIQIFDFRQGRGRIAGDPRLKSHGDIDQFARHAVFFPLHGGSWSDSAGAFPEPDRDKSFAPGLRTENDGIAVLEKATILAVRERYGVTVGDKLGEARATVGRRSRHRAAANQIADTKV